VKISSMPAGGDGGLDWSCWYLWVVRECTQDDRLCLRSLSCRPSFVDLLLSFLAFSAPGAGIPLALTSRRWPRRRRLVDATCAFSVKSHGRHQDRSTSLRLAPFHPWPIEDPAERGGPVDVGPKRVE
jgi:hypothetical protein